jgi:D-glycero-alpha-D-manno-heptose-7-phosphate kinase
VHITASAPTRIDLAGGTLDIWPLYLFHDASQTINVAISLRASCCLTPRGQPGVLLTSEDTGRTVEVSSAADVRDHHDFRLLGRLVSFFEADDLRLLTRSQAPFGAGIAGSSAMNIAVCGALSRWTGRTHEPEELMQIAMNIEAQAIDVPTGAQDYRPALYGGVSAVELGVGGVRRVPLDIDPAEIERRIVLAYTGASRNSGINNWEVLKRHIDGDRQVFDRFERIRDIAVAMRAALAAGDWDQVGRHVEAEWINRKGLAPGVSTPVLEDLMAAARHAGAHGGKVCGAGGGGCLFFVAPPDAVPAVRAALAGRGARLLDYRVDTEGLQVRELAPV